MANQEGGQKALSILERLKQSGGSSALAKEVSGVSIVQDQSVINPSTVAKYDEAIKPKKTSSSQVLFCINRGRSLGSPLPNGKMIRFQNGYLLTDNPEEIAFVRTNSAAWGVKEEV